MKHNQSTHGEDLPNLNFSQDTGALWRFQCRGVTLPANPLVYGVTGSGDYVNFPVPMALKFVLRNFQHSSSHKFLLATTSYQICLVQHNM